MTQVAGVRPDLSLPPGGEELARAAVELEGAHPSEVIAWALQRFGRERSVVLTGLQAEGVAVADMAVAVDPQVRIVTIDTGRLPAETHEYIDTLREHFGRAIEVVHPDAALLTDFTTEHGVNAFYTSVQLRLDCCHIRKVEPLERVLGGVDAWFTGLRRTQSDRRAHTPVVEHDLAHGGIAKVNPVATWTDVQVREHLRRRGVPLHPLYSRGYTSIGCAPCTRAVQPGEHERAGRWWWEQGIDKECGIHGRPQEATEGGTAS
ncbi:MAG TPA: phosphoadenylyl-sulfate reductase [Candidatus Dormibacteraeota bacterium]|nr:phosphoadenylyl-sulfate reductase [Candidatus Dormibacteraeota bacterium]